MGGLLDFDTALQYSLEIRKSFVVFGGRVEEILEKCGGELYVQDAGVQGDDAQGDDAQGNDAQRADAQADRGCFVVEDLRDSKFQAALVREMRRYPKRIYIALVRDDTKMDLWLKHRFWLACVAGAGTGAGAALPRDQKSEPRDLAPVHVAPALRRYLLDVLVHVRTHRLADRARAGGVDSHVPQHVLDLARCLARSSARRASALYTTPATLRSSMLYTLPWHVLTALPDANDAPTATLCEALRLARLADSKAETPSGPDSLWLPTLVVRDSIRHVVPPA